VVTDNALNGGTCEEWLDMFGTGVKVSNGILKRQAVFPSFTGLWKKGKSFPLASKTEEDSGTKIHICAHREERGKSIFLASVCGTRAEKKPENEESYNEELRRTVAEKAHGEGD